MREFDVAAPDGRTLRVHEGGADDGFPVFVHHGTPSAGNLFRLWHEDAAGRGIRLLSHDRPGYGGSDRHEGRSVADVAADVRTIADDLGLDRIATWGGSGGGPHALACGALMPERVTRVATLAGVAPYGVPDLDFLAGMGKDNITEIGLALNDRDGLRRLLGEWAEETLATTPEHLYTTLESLLSDADRAVLTGEVAEYMHESSRLGLSRGIDGWFDDDLAFTRDWGFDVADLSVPVLIWQGNQDLMVPASHGEWLGRHIPGADARVLGPEGHLTLIVNRVGETHAWLLAQD